MSANARDSHASFGMPAKTALAREKGENGQTVCIWFQVSNKRFRVFQFRKFEHSIQPGEHVAAFAECATQHSAFRIDEIEPEAERRLRLFGRYDDTHGTGCSDSERPVVACGTS